VDFGHHRFPLTYWQAVLLAQLHVGVCKIVALCQFHIDFFVAWRKAGGAQIASRRVVYES